VTAKRRRYAIIDNRKKDEWSGFADLLANLIEKYAAVLDIEPPICLDSEKKEIVNNSKLFEESIEKTDIA
jgi:Cu2+-containing amine oxidase